MENQCTSSLAASQPVKPSCAPSYICNSLYANMMYIIQEANPSAGYWVLICYIANDSEGGRGGTKTNFHPRLWVLPPVMYLCFFINILMKK